MSETQSTALETRAAPQVALDEDASMEREFISTEGGGFSIGGKPIPVYDKDGKEIPNEVASDVSMVVLAAVMTRSYFKDPYKPGVEQSPTCFAVGKAGIPSKNSLQIMAADCASCPLSAWDGSTPPQCKERRKLVGVRVEKGQMIPKLSSLNVPPTSVNGTKKHPGGWTKYLSSIGLKDNVTKDQIVTKIRLRSNSPDAGYRLTFENVGPAAAVVSSPEVLAGFKGFALKEAMFEPAPKEQETDVVAKAQANTIEGKAAAKETVTVPKKEGKKF